MATVEFEERADQLTLETIDATLSDGQIFRSARKKLLATGAKLLVGPRGTGKTHLMRYTSSVPTLFEQIQLISQICRNFVLDGSRKQLIQRDSLEHRQAQDL